MLAAVDTASIDLRELSGHWAGRQNREGSAERWHKSTQSLDVQPPVQACAVRDCHLAVLHSDLGSPDRNIENSRCVLRVATSNGEPARLRRGVARDDRCTRCDRSCNRTLTLERPVL